MSALAQWEARDDRPHEDHFVRLRGVSWSEYQRVLKMRGDQSGPRITYLEGTLEIMRPPKLALREVWYWRRGHIRVYALRGDRYEDVPPQRGSPWDRSGTTGHLPRSPFDQPIDPRLSHRPRRLIGSAVGVATVAWCRD